MTDFKDFLNQVKIRLTNPLIFSFLVSWTIINWRIVLGAFYLNENSLNKLKYDNYLDFVSGTIDWKHGFCYPLTSAIVYTIVSPALRLLIQLFNTWINKVGNKHIRKVAKESFIQYEIYDQLLEELQIQRKRNEDMLNENVLLSDKLSNMKSEYIKMENNLNLTKSSNQELTDQYNKTFDTSILNGKWKRSLKNKSRVIKTEEIIINQSRIQIKQSKEGYYRKYYISNFVINRNGIISFVEESIDQTDLIVRDASNSFTLKYNYITNLKENGSNTLSGDYNKNLSIELERIPD